METHLNHPGIILKEEFLQDYGLSVSTAAAAMGLPRQRLNEIVNGKRDITAETALFLGTFFGNAPEFWLNLQSHYNLALAQTKEKKRLAHVKSVASLLPIDKSDHA
ncbi:MAG: HigA family addiction module antitoxin [Bdellovibrionales bacterium]